MLKLISIKPSPATPDKIVEIKVNLNGKIYSGLLIKEVKGDEFKTSNRTNEIN